MRLTKKDLEWFIVFEHRLWAWTNEALECRGWCIFHCLKQWFLCLTAFAHCELNHFGEDFLPGLSEDGIKGSIPNWIALVMKVVKEEVLLDKPEHHA